MVALIITRLWIPVLLFHYRYSADFGSDPTGTLSVSMISSALMTAYLLCYVWWDPLLISFIQDLWAILVWPPFLRSLSLFLEMFSPLFEAIPIHFHGSTIFWTQTYLSCQVFLCTILLGLRLHKKVCNFL